MSVGPPDAILLAAGDLVMIAQFWDLRRVRTDLGTCTSFWSQGLPQSHILAIALPLLPGGSGRALSSLTESAHWAEFWLPEAGTFLWLIRGGEDTRTD